MIAVVQEVSGLLVAAYRHPSALIASVRGAEQDGETPLAKDPTFLGYGTEK